MRISSIQFFKDNTINVYNRKQKIINPKHSIPDFAHAYQDYNINFRGRTPEDFYAQEFNVKYMPATMKKYLDADYESRKYLPPEQVMSESFKYLEIAENLDEARNIYPDEPLFSNLHEASMKGRSGILADIKISKELSDTPLFKDGSDNFGMYLLKKIYLEGKTIKEINKDFYEEDLCSEYKGAITQPITYGTTSAYGIKYPKTDFWNSFIATRDEYKKFFIDLPKKTKSDLKKELTETKNNKITEPKKTYTRKFNIKTNQKTRIKDDIKKAKGDKDAIEKSIRKHFSKDDPEASFIVKYLSPIMTIAADRVHLSQEEKDFAEGEKTKGRKIENLFAQFWKAKPELLDYYSTAITDTIELFEETYESGGMIPINKDYQIITSDVENQKAIDYVPKRFAELLDYVQTIIPNRQKAYAEHDKLQNEWEEHFKWRYGDLINDDRVNEGVNNGVSTEPAIDAAKEVSSEKHILTPEELLEIEAKKNNAKVYHLQGTGGKDLVITANLDETLGDYVKFQYPAFPSKFVKFLTSKLLKNPFMNENAKLSFATLNIQSQISDSRIIGSTERNAIVNFTLTDMPHEHSAATFAVLDTFAKYSNAPVSIYRSLMTDCLPGDRNEYGRVLVEFADKPEVKSQINNLYDRYKTPLKTSEIIKITQILVNYFRNMDIKFITSKESVLSECDGLRTLFPDWQQWFISKDTAKRFKNLIMQTIPNIRYSRTLLDKDVSAVQYRAKCEMITHAVISCIAHK